MHNNTLLDRYKRAIKAKYEEEKDGEYFYYLHNPSRGKLRDLCWIIFDKEKDQEDLNVFSTSLGLSFDRTKKNKFNEQKDKFRPIETFFKGETDPANIDTINLAAVLVDFQPRPYNKFRRINLNYEQFQKEKPDITEREKENQHKENGFNQDSSIHKPQSFSGITKSKNIKVRFLERLLNRSKTTIAGVTIIFTLIAAVIYFAFFKKDCMQWSEDHYEVVDCTENIEGNPNPIIQLDEKLLDFRKVVVCDTTTCFTKGGQPLIWYSKSNNKVDFFNMLGIHPLNGKSLRPITNHIFERYKGDCKTKKSGSAN